RLLTTWCSTVIFPRRTFTSLVNTRAGRTQGAAVGQIFRCAPNLPQSAALKRFCTLGIAVSQMEMDH
ncbi:MAG: hypothetical protein KUG82_03290, partial [Pseudomonadales bacterium]|nr:hypothetical protein [Pseudomonadales bacterium]